MEGGGELEVCQYKPNWPQPFGDKKVQHKDVESVLVGNDPLYLEQFHPKTSKVRDFYFFELRASSCTTIAS